MDKITIESGIITNIYLENFVTYNQVTIKPGRNLNLIIGPNGTGKSTVVCALVLGLGGKPHIIRHGSKMKDYIKAGHDTAKIEIKLTERKNKIVKVTRCFNKEGKSTWMLDDVLVNCQQVEELIRKLNIQMDNLCQFLPQDKIQDFSKMDPQKLLQNTQKSVGDPILFEYHEQLKNHRILHKKLEEKITTESNSLELCLQKRENFKSLVSNIKERKSIANKITSLEQKKAWMLYNSKSEDVLQAQKVRDKAARQMKILDDQLTPADKVIQKIKSDIEILKKSINEHKKRETTKNDGLNRCFDTLTDMNDKVKKINLDRDIKIQTAKDDEREINETRQLKNKLENDLIKLLEETESEQVLIKKHQDILSQLEEHRRNIITHENKILFCSQQTNDLNYQIRNLEYSLSSNNIQDKRLNTLKEYSHDAYRGVMWLREHKNQFSAPIHEPMILNINMEDAAYKKYLEHIIPVRDLVAFICESKEDMNLLLRSLRDECKLQVNVAHSDPNRAINLEPNIPIDSIRKYGFTHYLMSFIDAPMAIKRYLVSMYRVNNVPLGTNEVENNVDHIPSNIRCYFSKNNCYSVNISKYTGDKSVRISPVSDRGLLEVEDKKKSYIVKQQIEQLKEKIEMFNKQAQELNQAVKEVNDQVEKLRPKRDSYQQKLQTIEMVKRKIQMREERLKKLMNERTTVENINAESNKKIQKLIKDQLTLYDKYNTLLRDSIKSNMDIEEMELALDLQRIKLADRENDCAELREKLEDAEKNFKQSDLVIQPMKVEMKKLYDEAVQLTNGIEETQPEFHPIKAIFNKLPNTIEEIDNELIETKARVYCMKNNADADKILTDYEEVEKKVQDTKKFIDQKTIELGTITVAINEIRDKWLPMLELLINRINHNFSKFLADLKCAGQVVLSRGDNNMDFSDYGLQIKVKFRDEDELQNLDRHHQSGGERALTTAIYMIALQELAIVPFRCVDEINQGMDPVNERRVFELLVNITSKPESSQYFLLTPKLLPNLKYNETVTVHCVFNGPYMISHSDFNMSEYCKHVVKIREKE